MTAAVLISEGALETLPQTGEDLAILRGHFEAHETFASTDARARSVRARRQGAFTSEHGVLHIREEFGLRGHVLYLMTVREHAMDEAIWIDLEFSDLFPVR